MNFYQFRNRLLGVFFIILLVIVFILSIVGVLLGKNNFYLQEELKKRENQISYSETEISQLKEMLVLLNASYTSISEEKEKLNHSYSDLKRETEKLLTDVDVYQKNMKESLEWYKQNSLLGNSSIHQKIKRHIEENCVLITEDECRIKLACFDFVNSIKLDLNYISDDLKYGKDDKLASVEEFLDNSGGDCEDYALFFKAEFNHILNKYKDKKIIIESWEKLPSNESPNKYWLNFQKTWFLKDAVVVEIKDYIYPNIICGNLYDPILDEIGGHCILAFTKDRIRSVADLSKLNNAYMVEPQDGSFKGRVNSIDSGVYLLGSMILYESWLKSWIFSVISDEDYFLYNEDLIQWQSCGEFLNLLETKKEKLFLMLTEEQI
jgi:cell division protein FtsL